MNNDNVLTEQQHGLVEDMLINKIEPVKDIFIDINKKRRKGLFYYIFWPIKKLYLNIKKIFNVIILSKIKFIISKFTNFLKRKEIKELNEPITSIIGYGIIGLLALHTFFDFELKLIYVLGAGSTIYLLYDALDYITIKINQIIRGNMK